MYDKKFNIFIHRIIIDIYVAKKWELFPSFLLNFFVISDMLQKNGNFFPVFFLISSLFLIYRNRKKRGKLIKLMFL
ncbi:hypothetical protein DW994_16260 [Mediterraneibacter gnavus]|nr:hypothetical protein DW994_16260 [Mediterraneibacter gnavus]